MLDARRGSGVITEKRVPGAGKCLYVLRISTAFACTSLRAVVIEFQRQDLADINTGWWHPFL